MTWPSQPTLGAVLVAVAMSVIAACGAEPDRGAAPTTPTTPTTPTATEPPDPPLATPGTEPAVFGDGLRWPCRPAADDAPPVDPGERGVSATTVTIGVGDDRGIALSPGLNREMTDAVVAFIERCNELGGIRGRTVIPVVYDAAVFEVATVMTRACDEAFMLVGHGFAFDDQGETIRLACELPAIPAFTVGAASANAALMYQAVPDPADQAPLSHAAQVAELFGERIERSAIVYAEFGATAGAAQQVLAAWPLLGYDFATQLTYTPTGEDDWTPLARRLRADGVGHVFFSGPCLPMYRALRTATALEGLDAVWTSGTNLYTRVCAEANADGVMDGTFVRLPFLPFEEAGISPAVADFLEIVEGAGAEPSLLGMEAASAFLLWASAADACGAVLSTACVMAELAAVDHWDGGGLHVASAPRDNEVTTCGILMELVGTEFRRVAPAEPGTFACHPEWSATVTTPAVEAARLDADRVATAHAPR